MKTAQSVSPHGCPLPGDSFDAVRYPVTREPEMSRWQRNLTLIGLALLLTCCARDDWGPMTAADRNEVACRGYGFYPGSREFDECMKYVESPRAKR